VGTTGCDGQLKISVGLDTRHEWCVVWPGLLHTDLDFADDVCLLAELLELLIPVLEIMASEATLLGFEVNWQKTKVHALGTRVNVPPTITVQGQQVAVVDQFV